MPENDIKPWSPAAPPEAGKRDGLKLKKNYYEPPAEAEPNIKNNKAEAPAVFPQKSSFHQRNSSQRLRQNILFTAGWLLFMVLGGGLIYIRFFSGLPGLAPDLLKQYGMIAVGIAYLVSILLAIKDNMFDGLLAIIVPFYPLYYLFLKSGSVFLCALTAAFLAAFGFDCMMLLNHQVSILIDKVSLWIQHV